MSDDEKFNSWFSSYFEKMKMEMFEYISIDTSLGKENCASSFLTKLLADYGFISRYEAFSPGLACHSAYTASDHTNSGSNVRALWAASLDSTRAILFNSHVDVVPADGCDRLFEPSCDGEYIYGRGACDTKGNLFLLLGALEYMKDQGLSTNFKILLDLVSAEEVGGNGTLSTILNGVVADFAIVFEPTDLMVHRGHRGCLTCELKIKGKGVHMGGDEEGASAIKAAIQAIYEIENIESDMLNDARRNTAFSVWKRPLQINVGSIEGGEWPGSVPENCTLRFNVGFLPDASISDIEHLVSNRLGRVLESHPDISYSLDFAKGLRNKAYLISEDNDFVSSLNSSVSLAMNRPVAPPVYAWRVSCDARHYAHEAEIDTVVFGAGSLKDAHSATEKISISQVKTGIQSLVHFLTGSTS